MRFSVSDPFPLFGLWDLSLPHHSCKLDSSCAAHVLLFSFCSFPSRNYHMSFLWFPNQRREGGKERKKGDGVTENRGGQMMSASHPCSFTDLKHFNLIWKAVGHLTGWFSQWCSCHSSNPAELVLSENWLPCLGLRWLLAESWPCFAACFVVPCYSDFSIFQSISGFWFTWTASYKFWQSCQIKLLQSKSFNTHVEGKEQILICWSVSAHS